MFRLISWLFRSLKNTCFFCLRLIFEPHGLTQPDQPVYTSRLMRWYEKIPLLNKHHKGICINGTEKLNLKNSLTHCLVHGGTGSGKTSSVIIPTVLQTDHSCIVVDLDGAIYRQTAGFKQKQGYDIQVLNFGEVNQSLQYNPLALCKNDSDRKNLAEILVQTAYPGTKGENLFWNQGAASLLYILLRLLQTQSVEHQNLLNLLYLLNLFPKLKKFIAEHAQKEVWTDYLGFMGADERVRNSHLATARMALDKLAHTEVSLLTADHTISFDRLVQPKSILYLIIPETKLPFYSFLLSLFFTQLFQFVQIRKPRETLFFLLDEFAQYHIPNFPTLATTLRRYNCSLTLIIQDLKQVIHQYGESQASTIVDGGCRTKLFLPGMSIQVAELLSKRIGQKTTLSTMDGKRHSYHRELLTPTELIQLKQSQALFLHGNLPPYLTRITPFFKQASLHRKTLLPPPGISTQIPVQPSYLPLSFPTKHD